MLKTLLITNSSLTFDPYPSNSKTYQIKNSSKIAQVEIYMIVSNNYPQQRLYEFSFFGFIFSQIIVFVTRNSIPKKKLPSNSKNTNPTFSPQRRGTLSFVMSKKVHFVILHSIVVHLLHPS